MKMGLVKNEPLPLQLGAVKDWANPFNKQYLQELSLINPNQN
jgi:hypothetical protein